MNLVRLDSLYHVLYPIGRYDLTLHWVPKYCSRTSVDHEMQALSTSAPPIDNRSAFRAAGIKDLTCVDPGHVASGGLLDLEVSLELLCA